MWVESTASITPQLTISRGRGRHISPDNDVWACNWLWVNIIWIVKWYFRLAKLFELMFQQLVVGSSVYQWPRAFNYDVLKYKCHQHVSVLHFMVIIDGGIPEDWTRHLTIDETANSYLDFLYNAVRVASKWTENTIKSDKSIKLYITLLKIRTVAVCTLLNFCMGSI